jgi:hypothetical protein
MIDDVRVGGLVATGAEAQKWVCDYFNRASNETGASPFAYPAYDELSTDSGPSELTDGDLLAPTLLNAAPSIAGFYWLRSVRSELESALSAIPVDLTLQEAVAVGSHTLLLAGVIGVLDDDRRRGVRLTTLTKVLHRKRPLFVPLYDQYVRACYVGSSDSHRLQPNRGHTDREFVAILAEAIATDLDAQAATWEHLKGLAQNAASSRQVPSPEVSQLRVLDVVAWNRGHTATTSRRRRS